MNLTVMNKCEKRFGFIKFDEMTRVKVLLLAVNSKRRKHLNSEDSEARFKVWYTFRTLSGDSGITVWSFEDRSSVPGPERWGLCNVKFHQNGDTVPLNALLQCSKIGFWLGVTMMTKKYRMRKKTSENLYHFRNKGVTLRWLIIKEHTIPDHQN